MIVVRNPKESLDQQYQSDHPDDRGHLEEAMKIFEMTEADLAALDELEFEQVVEFKADQKSGGQKSFGLVENLSKILSNKKLTFGSYFLSSAKAIL